MACNLKTIKLLDCALIGVCAVSDRIRYMKKKNTVYLQCVFFSLSLNLPKLTRAVSLENVSLDIVRQRRSVSPGHPRSLTVLQNLWVL